MSNQNEPDAWSGITTTSHWLTNKPGMAFDVLIDTITNLTEIAKKKIEYIRSQTSSMSIADMFDLQMAMNKLSQMSEMSTAVVSAMNSACTTVARNVKG